MLGAADVQIAVKRDASDNIVAMVELAKDGPSGLEIVSRLVPIDVGQDEDGDPIMSCVVEPVDVPEPAEKPSRAAKPRPLPKAAQIALRALRKAIDEAGEQAPASNTIPRSVRVVTVETWRRYA